MKNHKISKHKKWKKLKNWKIEKTYKNENINYGFFLTIKRKCRKTPFFENVEYHWIVENQY